MLFSLPVHWLIAVDITAWLVIHLAVAWAGTQLSADRFNPRGWLYRERPWEFGGRFYEKMAGIRAWKHLLPDGAALFAGGFRKARLVRRTPEYLQAFVVETCRGEAVHWVVAACSLLFFLWNPWYVGVIMVGYGLAANMPCILAQRYNRIRLLRVIRARGRG